MDYVKNKINYVSAIQMRERESNQRSPIFYL